MTLSSSLSFFTWTSLIWWLNYSVSGLIANPPGIQLYRENHAVIYLLGKKTMHQLNYDPTLLHTFHIELLYIYITTWTYEYIVFIFVHLCQIYNLILCIYLLFLFTHGSSALPHLWGFPKVPKAQLQAFATVATQSTRFLVDFEPTNSGFTWIYLYPLH